MIIRDLALIVGFLLLVPALTRIKWLNVKEPYKNVLAVLFCMLGLYFAMTFIAFFAESTRDYAFTGHSVKDLVLLTLASFGCTGFIILIMHKLQALIYIKRKRTTERNFRFLIVVMLIEVLYAEFRFLLSGKDANAVTTLMSEAGVGQAILALFVLFIVINSFRNSWISYLTKSQKIKSLFLSILFAISPLLFHKQFSPTAIRYSLAMDTLLSQLAVLLSVYWFTAATVILFHLPTAGIVDRKMQEIRSFRDLSRALSSEFDFKKLIDKISGLSIEITGANATYLQIYNTSTDRLHLVSYRNLLAPEIRELQEDPQTSVGYAVLQDRKPIWINNISKDNQLQYLRKWKRRFESVIAVPLMSYDKILGVLCVLKFQEYGFIPEDLDLMQAFADHAAIALENSRLVNESIEKERLEQELKVAHEAQMKLLPKTMPTMQGLDIDAICVTANEVGGDYFDFFQFDEHRIGVVVGDVSGKGAQAAFYMAEVKGIIKSLSQSHLSPRELLIRANDILCESFERTIFVSLIYAVIDRQKKEIVFSRAGHCPLLWYRKDDSDSQFVEPRGIGVGLVRGALFGQIIEEKVLPLSPGDTLLLFTDGVIEARNRKLQELEEESLRKLFTDFTQGTSSEIKKKLVGEIRTFVGSEKTHDDLTLVVVKIN